MIKNLIIITGFVLFMNGLCSYAGNVYCCVHGYSGNCYDEAVFNMMYLQNPAEVKCAAVKGFSAQMYNSCIKDYQRIRQLYNSGNCKLMPEQQSGEFLRQQANEFAKRMHGYNN